MTCSTDDGGAASALAHHVARAAAACLGCAGCLPGRVRIGVDAGVCAGGGVKRQILVGAAQRGREECNAVLYQAVVYHAACTRERVEGGEINVGDDADDDALHGISICVTT